MKGMIAYLQVKRTGEAIAWYERVFGAREVRTRLVAPNGTCMNAEIEIEGTRLMLADEMPSIGSTSPATLGTTSVVLDLHVADADAVFRAALEAGAAEVYPLADQYYGDRAGRVRDPFGHHWIIATRVREVSDAELVAAGLVRVATRGCGCRPPTRRSGRPERGRCPCDTPGDGVVGEVRAWAIGQRHPDARRLKRGAATGERSCAWRGESTIQRASGGPSTAAAPPPESRVVGIQGPGEGPTRPGMAPERA